MTVRCLHETSPSKCGIRVIWHDDRSWDAFDDDLFDAEVTLDRTGVTTFDRFGVARVLNIADRSIWRRINSGRIPGPDHYEPKGSVTEGIWTREQVIHMIAEGCVKPTPGPPHGSEARYRQHLRDGEKACGRCLYGVNKTNKERSAGRLESEPVNA